MRILIPAISSLLALSAAPISDDEDPPPVAVFEELDGTWKGQFVGYDTEGVELYRIDVVQTYRTLDENTQEVEIADTSSDGKTVRGKGRNTARRLPDGTLELRCVVDKSSGEHVEHRGRLVRGPDGTRELVWYSTEGRDVETFRETVRREGGAPPVYCIDGLGRYGDRLVLMAGRYVKEE